MTRQVCLAQHVKVSPADHSRTFTILERAPLRLPEHQEVWNVLGATGQRQLVVDDKQGEEAFPAKVVDLAKLTGPDVDEAMSRARNTALAAEARNNGGSMLSKEFDRSYDQQQEWLRLRAVLSQAKRGKRSAKRVLLLIE